MHSVGLAALGRSAGLRRWGSAQLRGVGFLQEAISRCCARVRRTLGTDASNARLSGETAVPLLRLLGSPALRPTTHLVQSPLSEPVPHFLARCLRGILGLSLGCTARTGGARQDKVAVALATGGVCLSAALSGVSRGHVAIVTCPSLPALSSTLLFSYLERACVPAIPQPSSGPFAWAMHSMPGWVEVVTTATPGNASAFVLRRASAISQAFCRIPCRCSSIHVFDVGLARQSLSLNNIDVVFHSPELVCMIAPAVARCILDRYAPGSVL